MQGFDWFKLSKHGRGVLRCCCAIGAVLLAMPVQAQELEGALQIFRDRCIECHGKNVQESDLRLDHREGLLKGGDSGQAIKLGHSDESLIIARVQATDETRMPPSGPALTATEIETLRRFIDQDAPWDSGSLNDPRLDHWAWQGLKEHQIPVSEDSIETERTNPIDSFLASAMIEHGIKPVARANREVLIRRLSFDLLGIGPSVEEVDQFVEDPTVDAWERLVDRMLASPEYGERWARHWLDIAHYADTHGFERDQRRDHAWRYRDWVIDALNSDLGYDKFVEHQIAGDVLPNKDADTTIASSFLAVGPWDFVGQVETPSPAIKRLARADDLDDMIAQVMTSICGVTIHCARCHHHKLDPIRQEEYYALAAIFSGVKRGDRLVSEEEAKSIASKRKELKDRKLMVDQELLRLTHGLLLADIVGGGNGFGTGTVGFGLDPSTGAERKADDKKGFLNGVVANRLNATSNPWIDSVFVPDGGAMRQMKISQTGIVAKGIPPTGSKVWDAIRNGPVNSQFSTILDGVDCSPPGRSMLSLHANAGITFKVQRELLDKSFPLQAGRSNTFVFTGLVGYFGETPNKGADVYVLIDGEVKSKYLGLGREDGLKAIRLELPAGDSLLTLIATDSGNGISHDQICFIDASIAPLDHQGDSEETERTAQIAALRKESDSLGQQLDGLPQARQVYGVVAEKPAAIYRLHRGHTEDAREVVKPGTIACVGPELSRFASLDDQSTDAQRRIALAQWLCLPENPLPARVIVNRLWHHHFGKGLVATPSDFGLGGSMPSHPELLDWLAIELQRGQWSLKRIHRMILLSEAYQRTSNAGDNTAAVKDAGNRLVWRQNPRRLDAESLRDAMLTTSGWLDRKMRGPGYRDFEYQEEYAPVYEHRVLEAPEVFRRSIYRFVVRTTPHPFLTSLDCPNPATLTPTRNTTTTAIQSLATLNNALVLQQCDHFAARLQRELPDRPEEQARRALRLAFGRRPREDEVASAKQLIQEAGLFQLCRILLNTNEFIYVD